MFSVEDVSLISTELAYDRIWPLVCRLNLLVGASGCELMDFLLMISSSSAHCAARSRKCGVMECHNRLMLRTNSAQTVAPFIEKSALARKRQNHMCSQNRSTEKGLLSLGSLFTGTRRYTDGGLAEINTNS